MHILLIHQAFAALNEPGGTRHHELARHLVQHGHTVTVIASALTYLTGSAAAERIAWVREEVGGEGITILRAYTYNALHRSFFHRLLSFFSFMFSSFMVGLRVRKVDVVWGTSPPIFQGMTAWLLARLKRAVFLFEVRDLWPAFAVAVGVLNNRTLIRMSEWLEGFLYRRADQLIVNSPGFIEHIQRRGGMDVALIPNGAEAAMFDKPSRHRSGNKVKFSYPEKEVAGDDPGRRKEKCHSFASSRTEFRECSCARTGAQYTLGQEMPPAL
jgi:hypothetical protein